MTCTTCVVSQSAHDKVLQVRPWRFCVVLATEKTYALHINYRKLNLIGRDGVDKEAQMDFCRPQSRSSVCVCHTGTIRLLASIYVPRVRAYSRDACLYTQVLLACSKYLYVHFTARA